MGLVIQNFVSLTLSLSPTFDNYISTLKANTPLSFGKKNHENPLQCIFFSTKNNSVFVILSSEILTNR